MVTSVQYSPRAAQALGYLNAGRNDVEIFVEDTAAPNLWVNFLKKYFPKNIKLESVNTFGSRKNVLAACKSDQSADGRRKLYIVDGDLDLLTGKPKPNLRHLYRLRSYCIENYLIDTETVAGAVTSVDPVNPSMAVRQVFDFGGWLDQNERLLYQLFVCYAVVYELRVMVNTVDYSVFRLIDKNKQQNNLCRRKVAVRVIGLYRYIRKHRGEKCTRRAYEKVVKNAKRLGAKRFVSAKGYIVPLIFQIVKTNFNVRMNRRQFSVLLAANAPHSADGYLKRRCQTL